MNNDEIDKWREEQLKKCLLPMQEDLVDWILNISDLNAQSIDLNVDDFYHELSDGVILCQLANNLITLLTSDQDLYINSQPQIVNTVAKKLTNSDVKVNSQVSSSSEHFESISSNSSSNFIENYSITSSYVHKSYQTTPVRGWFS